MAVAAGDSSAKRAVILICWVKLWRKRMRLRRKRRTRTEEARMGSEWEDWADSFTISLTAICPMIGKRRG